MRPLHLVACVIVLSSSPPAFLPTVSGPSIAKNGHYFSDAFGCYCCVPLVAFVNCFDEETLLLGLFLVSTL